MKNTTNTSFKTQNNGKFTFLNLDFTNLEVFNSFLSSQEKLSADNLSGDEAKTIEFFFFTPFTEELFAELEKFFSKEFFPKVKNGSFIKFNFFNENDFQFKKFNDFFSQFSTKDIFFELSFFSFPNDFNFSEFGFPSNFNGDFMFSVSQTSFR